MARKLLYIIVSLGGNEMNVDIQKKFAVHKSLLIGLFVFLIGQQIYFPMSYKYFHIALCFVFILITDIYDRKHRNYEREKVFMIVIAILGIVPIVDANIKMNLAVVYYIFLGIGSYLTLELMWQTYKMFKEENAEEKFSDRNKEIYNKQSSFITIYMGMLALIIVIAMSYAIVDLIKSII